MEIIKCPVCGEGGGTTESHRSGCCLGMVTPRSHIPRGSVASIIFEKYDKLHRAANSLVEDIQRTNPLASSHNTKLQILIRELGLEEYYSHKEEF